MNKTDLRKGMTAKKNAALFWNFRESMYYSLSENLYLCGQFENRSE